MRRSPDRRSSDWRHQLHRIDRGGSPAGRGGGAGGRADRARAGRQLPLRHLRGCAARSRPGRSDDPQAQGRGPGLLLREPVFVAAPRHAEVRERLLEGVARLRTGPSDEAGVDLGPLRTHEATRALNDAVEEALNGGERLLSPRPPPVPPEAPFLFPLTVVECAARSWFDGYESFGPVLSIRPFDTLDALLRRMETERHTLAAYFHTADPDSASARIAGSRDEHDRAAPAPPARAPDRAPGGP